MKDKNLAATSGASEEARVTGEMLKKLFGPYYRIGAEIPDEHWQHKADILNAAPRRTFKKGTEK